MAGFADPLLARLLRAADEDDVPAARPIAPGRVPATAHIRRYVLRDHAPAAAVQRKQLAALAVPDAEVMRRAAAGVAGFGAALPFFDEISRSFGPEHDLSGVRAHHGGDAARAAEEIGAEAYATGADVAFRAAPDLHTAAHEAAHVVQQRAGASGVGRAGDALERHADLVADRVVRGESAADLLPGAGGAGAVGVQRRKIADSGIAVPDDLSVSWQGDAFGLSFDATLDAAGRNALTVAIHYQGVFPVFADANVDVARKTATLRCTASDLTWVPADAAIAGDLVTIDLFGDGKTKLEIRQVCSLDASPDPNRNHQIATYVNSVMVDVAELRVGDPNATAPLAAAPAAQTPSSSAAPWTLNPVVPQTPDVTNLTPQSVMPPPRQPRPLTLQLADNSHAIFVGPPNDPEAWLRSFFDFYQLRAPIVNDLQGQRCVFNYATTTLADVVQIAIAQGALAGYDFTFDQVLAIAEPSMVMTAAPTGDGTRTLSFVYSFTPGTGHYGLNTGNSGDKPAMGLGVQASFALHNDAAGSEIAFGGQLTWFADPGPDGRMQLQSVQPLTATYAWAGDVVKDLLSLQAFSGLALGVARGQSAVAGVMKMYAQAQATLAGAGISFTIPGTDGRIQLGAQIAAQLSVGLHDNAPTTLDGTGQATVTVILDKSTF